VAKQWNEHGQVRPLDPYWDFDRRLEAVTRNAQICEELGVAEGGSVLPVIRAQNLLSPNQPTYAMFSIDCPKHSEVNKTAPQELIASGAVPGKTKFARPCVACRHVLHEDETLHYRKGLWRTQFAFYLCAYCFGRFERRRLKVDEECGHECWSCVTELIARIQQRDMSKFTDYYVKT